MSIHLLMPVKYLTRMVIKLHQQKKNIAEMFTSFVHITHITSRDEPLRLKSNKLPSYSITTIPLTSHLHYLFKL